MPTYVSLVKFTTDGLRTMKEKGIERSDAVMQNAQRLGESWSKPTIALASMTSSPSGNTLTTRLP